MINLYMSTVSNGKDQVKMTFILFTPPPFNKNAFFFQKLF